MPVSTTFTQAIFQRWADNQLPTATITASSAPATSYSLTTLQSAFPARRVLFTVTTLTLTFSWVSAVRGDLFALPVSNITGVATLANTSGLSQVLTIGPNSAGGWCPTSWVDLSASFTVPQRTASVWTLTITGNTSALIFGGGLWLGYPIRTLYLVRSGEGTSATAPVATTDYAFVHTPNEYLSDFVLDLQVRKRALSGTVIAKDAATKAAVLDWIDSNHGATAPGLFIRDTTVNDAFVCFTNASVQATRMDGPAETIALNLLEVSKGKPV